MLRKESVHVKIKHLNITEKGTGITPLMFNTPHDVEIEAGGVTIRKAGSSDIEVYFPNNLIAAPIVLSKNPFPENETDPVATDSEHKGTDSNLVNSGDTNVPQ